MCSCPPPPMPNAHVHTNTMTPFGARVANFLKDDIDVHIYVHLNPPQCLMHTYTSIK